MNLIEKLRTAFGDYARTQIPEHGSTVRYYIGEIADELERKDQRIERLEGLTNIPYMSAPEVPGDEWVLVKYSHLIALEEALSEDN